MGSLTFHAYDGELDTGEKVRCTVNRVRETSFREEIARGSRLLQPTIVLVLETTDRNKARSMATELSIT